MGDITDADYTNRERVCKDFEIKGWDEYHDLYVQSSTLLLAGIFNNFHNISLEICGLDPAHFFSVPGLARHSVWKKATVKLDLITNIDFLLMVEKGIRRRICDIIHRHANTNNKYKNYDKIKNPGILNIGR